MIKTHNDDARMASTMHQISLQDKSVNQAKKDNLLKEILAIEDDIKTASETAARPQRQVSPEQANKLQRDMIFMKRNLEKKKAELEALVD